MSVSRDDLKLLRGKRVGALLHSWHSTVSAVARAFLGWW